MLMHLAKTKPTTQARCSKKRGQPALRPLFVPLPYKKQSTKLGSSQHICRSKEMCISVTEDSTLMFRTNFFMLKIIRLLDISICHFHLVSLQLSTINCYNTHKLFCITCEYLAQLQLLHVKNFHLHNFFRYCVIKVKHT